MEKRFSVMAGGCSSCGGRHASASRSAAGSDVTAEQRAQAQQVFASSMSNAEKRVAISAILAGATVDLSAHTRRHAPMPGLAIGSAAPALKVSASRRHGTDGHFYMPGIPVGRAAS